MSEFQETPPPPPPPEIPSEKIAEARKSGGGDGPTDPPEKTIDKMVTQIEANHAVNGGSVEGDLRKHLKSADGEIREASVPADARFQKLVAASGKEPPNDPGRGHYFHESDMQKVLSDPKSVEHVDAALPQNSIDRNHEYLIVETRAINPTTVFESQPAPTRETTEGKDGTIINLGARLTQYDGSGTSPENPSKPLEKVDQVHVLDSQNFTRQEVVGIVKLGEVNADGKFEPFDEPKIIKAKIDSVQPDGKVVEIDNQEFTNRMDALEQERIDTPPNPKRDFEPMGSESHVDRVRPSRFSQQNSTT